MKRSDAAAVERPYHHGDLRRAIVEAALDTLRETQSFEFSLRELAGAPVSSPLPPMEYSVPEICSARSRLEHAGFHFHVSNPHPLKTSCLF